jgi:septum formation protein
LASEGRLSPPAPISCIDSHNRSVENWNLATTITQQTIILLASNSPRRRELMALGNWSFAVSVPAVDEEQVPGEPPADYVLRLAETKARAAVASARSEQWIVAADTAVVDGSALLGKPADAAAAINMLRRLRGHAHQVYTGLAVLNLIDGRLLTDLCVTDVPMRRYTDADIDDYVRSGDPFDKAGAYAIQHPHFRPVASLRGCYASVMGLPLCHLARLLARMHAASQHDLPAHCQAHLSYACPVSSAILRGEQVG